MSIQLFRRYSTAIALAVILAACAPPPPPPPPDTTAEDTAAINALRDAWTAAFNAEDVDTLLGLYTEDAMDMAPNQPTATGHAGLRDMFTAQFGMGQGTATVTSEELQLMGDWAYDRGTFTLTMTPEGGGEPVQVANDRYLVILRQGADGAWKLARLISNSPTPAAPAAAGS
jgi:uncharacterized protein (TIGR02246 family)